MGSQGGAAWEEGDAITHRTKEMVFCSLHHHNTYSYKDGYGTPAQHSEKAAELGMMYLATTNHGNVSDHVEHEQETAKRGVVPIFGSELYCGEVGEGAVKKKNHLTVLAENSEGYKNLLRVVSRGWAEGYYYEPTVSGGMLSDHSEGLVILSGCSGSLLSTSLCGGKNISVEDASLERASGVAARFQRAFGDAFYLEVQAFPELPGTCKINQGLARISEDLRIPLVATVDAHYTTPDESEMQAILHNIRGGSKQSLEDQAKRWSKDVKLCPLTDKDIYRRLVATGLSKREAESAIRNSHTVAERCAGVVLPKVTNLRYPLPPGVDSPEYLFRQWMNEGWKYRGLPALAPADRERYMERTKYEMDLIQQKGFTDYFLVVADAVQYAKDYRGPEAPSGIPVGPARGSAAASLVCYLLRLSLIHI